MLAYLLPRFGHVSFERVCSGRGLPNLYAFLKDSGRFQEPGWLKEELDRVEDPTPVIVQSALEGKDEICTATLELFVSILGSEAGNLALKVLAISGVYFGGGIPPRIRPFLRSGALIQSFSRKGRFSELLQNIPVHVICNPEVALIGAACHGLEIVSHEG
jgi:glucokinase